MPTLTLRLANMRRNQILEAQVSVTLVRSFAASALPKENGCDVFMICSWRGTAAQSLQ